MNITEIRVRLIPEQGDKLRGFASMTIDHCLVVRDIKIIEGGSGLFVAMPSRKLCDRCQKCSGKNHVRARFCNDCGARLRRRRPVDEKTGRPRLYADVAHPINQKAREMVQSRIIAAFEEELVKSKQEGYRAVEFHDLDYDYLAEYTG